MDDQGNQSLYNIISTIVCVYIKLIREVVELVNLEAVLAKKSLIKIIGLCAVAVVILFSTWFSVLGLLLLFLVQLHFSWLMAISVIVALNVLLLFIVIIAIMQLKKNLTFPATRRQISIIHSANKDLIHERIETKN